MALTITTEHSAPAKKSVASIVPGLLVVGLGVLGAVAATTVIGSVPLIVAAVLAGAALGNSGAVDERMAPGVAFASKTLLRSGIVLLGLRLSFGDIAALGWPPLLVIIGTVSITFFTVQVIGGKLGLSPGLSLLVASGFSICGNSAIASVKGVATAEEDEVAAAIGLVTLCGTAAIVVVPALGSALGLSDMQFGVWAGAGVQDTAQVIAVGSTVGPVVLAIATAVKLTRVLFLAPIVAAVAAQNRRGGGGEVGAASPAVLPLFVIGFLGAVAVRTSGLLPLGALNTGRTVEQYLLAAGMVGLGTGVRFASLRALGVRPLVLGAAAWTVVGGASLGLIYLLGI